MGKLRQKKNNSKRRNNPLQRKRVEAGMKEASKTALSPDQVAPVVEKVKKKKKKERITTLARYSQIIETAYDLENAINQSVFPGHQGGPHNHTISALSVALKQVKSPLFKEYQTQVLKNNAAFAERFLQLNYDLVSGGTDNHLLLVDLRSKGIDGARVERVLELVNIAANKNTVPGDKSALIPGGLRVGSPAMTSRGLKQDDFIKVADFIDRAVKITLEEKAKVQGKKLLDFKNHVGDGNIASLQELKSDVTQFATAFPTVGFWESEMKY